MKRFLSILLIFALLLSGCKATEAPKEEVPIEEFDNSGEKTVIYCGEERFPVSFSVNGEQQIQNGTYWYYELEKDYERQWDETFYTYDLKKKELSGSKEYAKLSKERCFATNGNWPLFLSPVHAEYTSSNQEMTDEAFVKAVQKQLTSNGIENETPIITDVWNCDMDGDGNQEVLFKASNGTEDASDTRYCFLVYAKSGDCQVLYSNFSAVGSEKDIRISPMVCDLNGDGKWGVLLHKISDYESFVIFDFESGNFSKSYEIIF